MKFLICFGIVIALISFFWYQNVSYHSNVKIINDYSDVKSWDFSLQLWNQRISEILILKHQTFWDSIRELLIPKNTIKVLVIWNGPFCNSGGFATEARTQFLALVSSFSKANFTANINDYNIELGLEAKHFGSEIKNDISNSTCLFISVNPLITSNNANIIIQIYHSVPNYWPNRENNENNNRRNKPKKPKEYWIGRTMYETNSVPFSWHQNLMKLDEIWVPSEFNRNIFSNFVKDNIIPYSGMNPPPVFIIEEGTEEINEIYIFFMFY